MPRYLGKVCLKHPELRGERRNGNCPACQRERPKPKRSRESQRAKVKKWRDANREQYLAGAKKRTALARVRRRKATVGDDLTIRREYRALQAKAKRLRLSVDHIVPLAGCRVCGAKGLHEPTNWQMLTGAENAAKGDRCKDCYEDVGG
jgi:hypothetical protein